MHYNRVSQGGLKVMSGPSLDAKEVSYVWGSEGCLLLGCLELLVEVFMAMLSPGM